MSAANMHRLAQAFRARLRAEIPGASDVTVLAAGCPDFGLAVKVTRMAPWRYSPAALAGAGMGPGARLLSPEGERLWAQLSALGVALTGERLTFALMHDPDALTAARDALTLEAA